MENPYYYQCVNCGADYAADSIRYLCPLCSIHNTKDQPPRGILKVLYHYEQLKAKGLSDLKTALLQGHYPQLLPLNNLKNLPNLRIGQTPVYNLSHTPLANKHALFVKDDSQNPTYSFKDRASAVVSAFAREQGMKTLACASTGNAGSSLAGICAAQQQQAIVFVPASAPRAKLIQIRMYGATLIPVRGSYDDAFDLCQEAAGLFGWFNRNTAYNPLTIEGKKTVSFEIYQQFQGKLPEYIFVPVGDGAIISGVYKGFEDLLKLGLLAKMPHIIAVQAEGSNNLIANLDREPPVFKTAATLADSIAVDIPRNFYMTKKYRELYAGKHITVNDAEIIQASGQLSKNTGLFAEPAAAAALAGFLKFSKTEGFLPGSKSLLILTGSGLKDLDAVNKGLAPIDSIECKIEHVKKLLHF